MLEESLVEAQKILLDGSADREAGTQVFGGSQERNSVNYESFDVAITGAGEDGVEAVEAAEEIVVDFVVRRFGSNAIGVLGDEYGGFGREILQLVSPDSFNYTRLWHMDYNQRIRRRKRGR
jgi:hypothetical protein